MLLAITIELFNVVISVLWEVTVLLILETLLSNELTAEASALVARAVVTVLAAAKASKATLSDTASHWVPVHLLGVFESFDKSIHKLSVDLSFSGGCTLLKIILPFSPTVSTVSDKLFFKETISVDCEVILFSAASTLLVRAATALESALVIRISSFNLALLNASKATLSETTAHSEPFHRLGVFLLSEVSIHRFWGNLSCCEGSVSR